MGYLAPSFRLADQPFTLPEICGTKHLTQYLSSLSVLYIKVVDPIVDKTLMHGDYCLLTGSSHFILIIELSSLAFMLKKQMQSTNF